MMGADDCDMRWVGRWVGDGYIDIGKYTRFGRMAFNLTGSSPIGDVTLN